MAAVRSVCFATLLWLTGACVGSPVPQMLADAEIYLVKYGYIRREDVSNPVEGLAKIVQSPSQNISSAIRSFQMTANLPMTGEIDDKTVEMMHTPRCGILDYGVVKRRSKRYTLLGSKWKKNILTYRIVNYSKQMSRTTTDYWVKRAFKVWTTVTPLRFFQIYNQSADIEIIFKGYYHGDPYDFDGKGGTLAHAFAPGEDIAGDAHFDDSENWIARNPNLGALDLFSVAVHEFGHVLGLAHYYTNGAIMSPFYGYIRDVNFVLNYDDINGIQSLYGAGLTVHRPYVPPTPRPPTTTAASTTTQRPLPEFCRREVQFDAIVSTRSGRTYAFEGWQYVHIWNGAHLDPTSPKQTSDVFSQLHWGADMAFSVKWRNRELIYIIKSWFAWIYDVSSMRLMNAQVPLQKIFPGLPMYLDAAFQWKKDGSIYIFKGDQYWKMEQVKRDVFKATWGFPRPITDWNLPTHTITAAMSWSTNDNTYFFSEQNYYKYDDNSRKVEVGYPRLLSVWWLGCTKKPNNLNSRPEPNHRRETSAKSNMAATSPTARAVCLVFTTAVAIMNIS